MTSIGTLVGLYHRLRGGHGLALYPAEYCTGPTGALIFRCFRILGILVCLAMMTSLDQETWWRLFIWLVIGLIIYFTYSRFNSRLNKKI